MGKEPQNMGNKEYEYLEGRCGDNANQHWSRVQMGAEQNRVYLAETCDMIQ